MSIWLIAPLFFAAAAIYSMAGFGGGSAYIAILTLASFTHDRIPVVSLACNIVVTVGGTYHFVRAGHFNWRRFWPFALGSMPLAFVGGRMPLTRESFMLLVGVSLLVAGALLIWPVGNKRAEEVARPPHRAGSIVVGGGLGLLSGMVGIGGGIFLAPLLLLLHWAAPKQVAAFSAVFILLNSLSGLAGQLMKSPAAFHDWQWLALAGAVLVGGQLGSRLGAYRVSQARVRQMTGVIVLAAALRILSVLFFC